MADILISADARDIFEKWPRGVLQQHVSYNTTMAVTRMVRPLN